MLLNTHRQAQILVEGSPNHFQCCIPLQLPPLLHLEHVPHLLLAPLESIHDLALLLLHGLPPLLVPDIILFLLLVLALPFIPGDILLVNKILGIVSASLSDVLLMILLKIITSITIQQNMVDIITCGSPSVGTVW